MHFCVLGIPVWVGRKVHTRYRQAGKHKRNCAVLSGVVASVSNPNKQNLKYHSLRNECEIKLRKHLAFL